jgi:imidazolonepropionase-like amidohydrolase
LLSPVGGAEPGIYLTTVSGYKPTRISRDGFDAHFGAAVDRVFFSDVVDDTKLVLQSVNLQGKDPITHLRGNEVTEYRVSPDGRWVAFTEDWNAFVTPFAPTGRTVEIDAGSKAIPVRQVSKRSGSNLHWSGDSKSLRWAHAATLYTRDLKDAFAFLEGAPKELPEPAETGLDLSFEVPADVPGGVIALVGGRVVTMRDADTTQEVIEDGVVLVRGNRIEAVGPREKVPVPLSATTIDVSGKTVIPGLVDAHAHGAMSMDGLMPQQNWMQFSNLAFGVTTIHDPSNDTESIFAAAELQRAGKMLAPRIYSTGTILYGANHPAYKAKIESLDDALFHVRRLKDAGAISVKSYQQPRRDQRQMVIEAARQEGIMVVPEGGAKFEHNMNEIVDGHTGIEHAIPLATAYDDVKQLWSQTGTGYTPTFVVAYGGLSGERYWYDRTEVWKDERLMRWSPRYIIEPASIRRQTAPDEEYNHFAVARFAKTLRDEGVGVHIGAHGQREGLAAHWELWMMEQGGFSPWEALRAGTIDGARYVGMDGDIGSIEPGKLADLVVIDGNPLENLRRSEFVTYTMINGRLYDAKSMSQVAPDAVEPKPFYFEMEGGTRSTRRRSRGSTDCANG